MKNSHSVAARIFLVGCPRSGTTLLQSLLAAHPRIASFPESHFFRHLLGEQKPWQSRLRIASSTARERLKQFLKEVDHPEMKRYLSAYAIFTFQYVSAFLNVLDDLTLQQGKNIWLEKTPSNLHYINSIEKQVPNTKFIHIIRNGSDVVASLYEVTHKYPDIWAGAWDIDRCIQRWIRDVKISLKYSQQPKHYLVRYEDMVKNPQLQLEQICQFLKIDFTENMLKDYSIVARQVSLKEESWKASVTDEIQSKNHHKFKQLFDSDQQSYILKKISQSVNLEQK